MAIYNSIYPTLKGLDANNAAAIVAAACQAFGWDAAGVARFCALINADPAEIDTIVRAARASYGTASPWLPST